MLAMQHHMAGKDVSKLVHRSIYLVLEKVAVKTLGMPNKKAWKEIIKHLRRNRLIRDLNRLRNYVWHLRTQVASKSAQKAAKANWLFRGGKVDYAEEERLYWRAYWAKKRGWGVFRKKPWEKWKPKPEECDIKGNYIPKVFRDFEKTKTMDWAAYYKWATGSSPPKNSPFNSSQVFV